ncbi:MAG: TolB family protein [Anaerolineales bacterium]
MARGAFSEISWSPDGTEIVAVTQPRIPVPNSYLYLVNASDGSTRRISDEFRVFSLPKWSPGESSIAVTLDGNIIGLVDLETYGLAVITEGEGAVWTQDGRELIVYVGGLTDLNSGRGELRLVDLQGRILRSFPLNESSDFSPSESPATSVAADVPSTYLSALDLVSSGEQIAFATVELNDGQASYKAYTVDLTSGEPLRLRPEEAVGSLSWSPDGSSIAYVRVATQGLEGELLITDRAGHCVIKPTVPQGITTVSWAPDGPRIAFLYEGDIYLLDLEAANIRPPVSTDC